MKHIDINDIWYLNNIKQHLKNLVLSCDSWRSECSEDLLNWTCFQNVWTNLPISRPFFEYPQCLWCPTLWRRELGKTMLRRVVQDILFSATGNWDFVAIWVENIFCWKILDSFCFRHSHCQQHQCLLTQKWTFEGLDDSIGMLQSAEASVAKHAKRIQCSQCHQLTTFLRRWVQTRETNRWVLYFLFWGEVPFLGRKSESSWLNHMVFRAA